MSKDEMDDLQEPREEDPKLEAAIAMVRALYDAYKRNGVDEPLATALHTTWRGVCVNEMP